MTSKKFRGFSQSALLTAVLLLQFTLAARTQDFSNESAAPAGSVTFNFVATPDILAVGSLAADSENDIWATSVLSSVSLHFNGSRWKLVPMAKAGRVNRVAVLSSKNVWAVGQKPNEKFSQIQHFNGTRWTVVSSPHFAEGEDLNSLKAISANNIFAVGASLDNGNNRTPLLEHFDGAKWSVVSLPKVSGGELFDIAIISPSDMWAVGGTASAALTMHFNGQQWSRVPAPFGSLFGVAALSTNNVWAVGIQLPNGAVIEHWTGKSWKVVTSPNTGNISRLIGISAISPTDIWAAGCTACGDVGGGAPALIEHWNGTAWSVNPAPVEGSGVSGSSVLTFPSGHIFVGGFAFAQSGPASVIMKGVEGQ